MSAITKIKRCIMGGHLAYNADNDLIATIHKIEKTDPNYKALKMYKYTLCIVGGIAHGKVAYAVNWQDVNDKTVEIANLPR